jgi:hypothetical protein
MRVPFLQGNFLCAACGTTCGVLTAEKGSLSDGSGGMNYANNANCMWLIAPPGATQITISFTAFVTGMCAGVASFHMHMQENVLLNT